MVADSSWVWAALCGAVFVYVAIKSAKEALAEKDAYIRRLHGIVSELESQQAEGANRLIVLRDAGRVVGVTNDYTISVIRRDIQEFRRTSSSG